VPGLALKRNPRPLLLPLPLLPFLARLLLGTTLVCCAGYTNPNVFLQREEEPVAELYCPCPERHKLWGEFWWVEGKHQWVFFDDLQTSETYAEQVERCPACGRRLERKILFARP
jgi:hypothetical protein